MKRTKTASIGIALITLAALNATAQDWPQWRGPNRDGKAAEFKAPKAWPKELTQKWKITVGEGVASPVLAGDKVFVFSRQDGNEVTRCVSLADGKESWSEKYESLGASGPAQSFSGPRSTPAIASGKIVTVGVRGMISCLDATTGKKLWRKDDFRAWPNFFPSSSPLIANGLAIAQLGGRDNGALVAYDLATGDEKWRWSGPSPAYASPVVMNIGGSSFIVAHTESKLVAVNVADGKFAWELVGATPAGGEGGPGGQGGPGGGGRGRGGPREYRAATPAVDGQTLIVAGRGVKALKLEKDGAALKSQELWNQAEKTVSFNSPILHDGLVIGLAGNNELFCIKAKDGSIAWSAPFPGTTAPEGGPRASLERALSIPAQTVFAQATPADPNQPNRPERPGGGPGGQGGPGGRRGGGGGGGGYGSIIGAGTVLMALTPAGQLVVFEPSDKEFKQLASYKVGNQTHASPVLTGNRILIKDRDTLALWTVD